MNMSKHGEFDISDLLISRTDERGMLCSTNEAFRRVSGYAAEELLNAPHKMLRDPDLPEAVYWLMMERLKRQEPVCAFMKNKSKSGASYWSFASIAPLDKGYLSMRIAPTAGAISMCEDLYATLLQEEQDGLSPEESANRLRQLLKERGFDRYGSFMANSAGTEINARSRAMGERENRHLLILADSLKAWDEVRANCNAVFKYHHIFAPTSINLQIQAASANEDGKALGLIAQNFSTLANALNSELFSLSESVDKVERTIQDGMVMGGLADLLRESRQLLREEQAGSEQDTTEFEIMQRQAQYYQAKIQEDLTAISKVLDLFSVQSKEMSRSLSALSVTRVMCAIENERLQNSGTNSNSVSGIIDQLDQFKCDTDACLADINRIMSQLKSKLKAEPVAA